MYMQSRQIRKERRFPADKLPIKYRSLDVITPSKRKISVLTADASLSGFGFFTKEPTADLHTGTSIELHPEGSDETLPGKVAYVNSGVGITRVGVSLEEKEGYQGYKKDLPALIKNIEKEKKIL